MAEPILFQQPDVTSLDKSKKFAIGKLGTITENISITEYESQLNTTFGIAGMQSDIGTLEGKVSTLEGEMDTAQQDIIDLQDAIGTTPDTWHVVGAVGEPVYQNNYVAGLGGYTDGLQFKKVGSLLLIRGSCSGGNAATIFTLPANYRPYIRLLTPIFVENAQSVKGAYIDTNGNFVLLGGTYQVESCNLVLAL